MKRFLLKSILCGHEPEQTMFHVKVLPHVPTGDVHRYSSTIRDVFVKI